MGHKRRSHRELAALAASQHGVVGAAQLRRLGFSRDAIAAEVAIGSLHPMYRGTYAVGHADVPPQGRGLAGVLSCGSGTLLSHRSAAWLWGITQRWQPRVEVTADSPRRTRRGLRIHSSRRLVQDDSAELQGVPVTALPRTLLDLAAVDPPYIKAALNRAARLGLLDLVAVDGLLRRCGGSRGAARLRAALEDHRDPSFTRSGLERRFLRLVVEAGLPRPSVNFFVAGHEVDMYWHPEKLAVELDTFDYHGGRHEFEADRVRDETLRLAGIEVTRVTGKRLDREPSEVLRRLKILLNRRRVRRL